MHTSSWTTPTASGAYDPLAVAFYDIAHEGAQIRAVAQWCESEQAQQLCMLQPRSVIILCPEHWGRAVARLALAVAEPMGCPVHISDQLPRFAGSLDVVVAISECADHDGLSQSIVTAARRGCHVVVACAPHGHIAADAEDVAAIGIPALPLAQGPSPARVFAVVTAVLRCLDHTVRAAGDISVELSVSADHADRELQECSPERDQLVNPARQLALLSGRVIHSGRGLVAASLADTMSALWTAFGRASASIEAQELEVALPRLEPKEQNIFYDPEFDAPPSSNSELPLHTVLWLSAETVAWARSQVSEDTTHERDGVIRMLARGYAATAFLVPQMHKTSRGILVVEEQLRCSY